MLTRLYNWMIEKSAHPKAEYWLFLFSFMESSFFPIPPHPLLGLMCLAKPEKALRFGVICTLASVLGGMLGYAIGYFAYESFGIPLLKALGLWDSFPAAACFLKEKGAMLIILKGATPIPFKLVTITAGFIHLSLFTLIWASTISRGFQFMVVGFLFWKFGAPIKAFIDKYLIWVSVGFVALVVGGFLVVGQIESKGATDSGKCSKANLTTNSTANL